MDAYIKGISYYLPKKVITNEEISSEFPEWTVEKIYTKLGIKERHVVDKGETALDLGVNAAKKLFEEYSFSKEDIGFLIFCTQSPDYHYLHQPVSFKNNWDYLSPSAQLMLILVARVGFTESIWLKV